MNCTEISKSATQISHLKHFPTRLLKKLKKKPLIPRNPIGIETKTRRGKIDCSAELSKVVIIRLDFLIDQNPVR